MELAGRVAVVTGSASGLGRAMAERFAAEGMTTVVADNRLPAAEAVAASIRDGGGGAWALPVDVGDRDSVIALADEVDRRWGGAQVLVNNAGVVSNSPILQAEEAGWRWIVDVNLFGVLYGMQTFVPRMLAGGADCHVVNTASLAGVVGDPAEGNRLTPGTRVPTEFGGMGGYMVTKHAVVALSETAAGSLRGTRVGVSVLCPSHHENTGIFENSARHRPDRFGGAMSDDEIAATLGQRERRASDARVAFTRYPEECAARVVRAVREGHFYIFTHPESRGAVERRFAQILAGYDDAAAFETSDAGSPAPDPRE
jgi:NAD(P)-dependent dehydrogenase (short-subunit alcohol dehydrogenase family)